MSLRRLAAAAAIIMTSRLAAQTAPAGQPQFSPERRAADSLLAAKKYPEAMAAFERLTTTEPNRPGHWSQLGFAAYGAGKYAQAAEAFVKSNAIVRNGPARYNAAAMYAKAGNKDAAFAWIDSAIATLSIIPEQVAADSDFDAIRSDARWAAAMDRASKALTPCMSDANYRRLDFWIGDWDVKAINGQVVGQSRVEPIAGGCALLENWSPGPGRPGGKSGSGSFEGTASMSAR